MLDRKWLRKIKGIILDRDGVINDLIVRDSNERTAPWNVQEFTVRENVILAIELLRRQGFKIFVATNQPDVATGKISEAVLGDIHNKMKSLIPEIEGIYVCPHLNLTNCFCRKPRDGLIRKIFREHGLVLSKSWMIGDRWVDIAAANSFNLRSVLLCNEDSWKPNSSGKPGPEVQPTFEVADILGAVELIVKDTT